MRGPPQKAGSTFGEVLLWRARVGMQKIFQRLGHVVGRAEGVGQGCFEGGGPIVAEAVGEDQGDGRFAAFVIEATAFETVLAMAKVDDGPLAFFSHNYNGAQK